MSNTQNAKNNLNNQSNLQAVAAASRTASGDSRKTLVNNFRNTGLMQLMTYSDCKTFRISDNFVKP